MKRRLLSYLLVIIMMISLIHLPSNCIVANAETYDAFKLYYYYEGTEPLYVDIWNHAGIEFATGTTCDDYFGWNKQIGQFEGVESNTNWYVIDFMIAGTDSDGFDIYIGDSSTKLATYDN